MGKKSKKGDIAIMIAIGKVKKNSKMGKKAEMMNGGMAYGKKHMYAAGGSVKINPGLKALRASSPSTFEKITGKSA